MATGHPSEHDIRQVEEFCQIPRAQAVVLLMKYKILDQAVVEYWNNPEGSVIEEIPSNQWGPEDNLPAFQIESDDVNLPTMSRPPSRMEARGPYAEPVDTSSLLRYDSQDVGLQKAIESSRYDMPAQEIGIVTTEKHFGPANRPHYDEDKWAMTATVSSREIVEQPPPSKRRRASGEPAFLMGSAATGYLAPLLNIYHSIPLSKQALLCPSLRVHNYGNDSGWWSGSSDENVKSLAVEATTHPDPDRHNFLAELQCLMAFLDGTDRAYGSVDALSQLHLFRRFESESPISHLLEVWQSACMQQNPADQLSQIFSSQAVKNLHLDGVPLERKEFLCLEPPVEDQYTQTLIDLLDLIIWHDSIGNVDDVWMEFCAEVFTIRLHGTKQERNGLGLEIPSVWYPDRYMNRFKDAARNMREQVLGLRQELQAAEIVQRRCERCKSADKRIIKIREVLETASEVASKMSMDGPHAPVSDAGPSTDLLSGDDDPVMQIHQQLRDILQRLDEKVQALMQQKQKLQNEIHRVSHEFAKPSTGSDNAMRKKYVLQGVSTHPNITYVRKRIMQEADLIEFENGTHVSNQWQWWRFEHRDSIVSRANIGPQSQLETTMREESHSTYSIQQTSEAEVLEAARTDGEQVLLVYADQRAVDLQAPIIGPALRKFVEQDNRTFHQELENEAASLRRQSHETGTTIMDDILIEDSIRAEPPTDFGPASMPAHFEHSEVLSGRHGASDTSRSSEQNASVERSTSAILSPRLDAQGTVGNKIGAHADALMEKYGIDTSNNDEPIHIEHGTTPLR